MDPLYEYLVTINYHFIGVVVAGIMIGTLFIFGFLYYFYIEQTQLIAYISLYFLFVFLGLLSNSLLILSKTDAYSFFTQQQLYEADVLFDYLVIYSVFLTATYLLQRSLYTLRLILLGLIPIFVMISHLLHLQWLLFFWYLYLLMGICIYLTSLEMKRHDILKNVPFMTTFLLFIVYYTLSYNLVIDQVPFNTLEWIFSIIVVIVAIVYFMYRYKNILIEKDSLYNRLTHDFLTGIYSKSYFMEVLDKTEKGIIIFIDINHFKWINDELGHYTGDDVLKIFAKKLIKLSNDNILCCRFGGDEFAFLLTNMNIEDSQFLATKLMNEFKETLKEVDIDNLHPIGISTGLSTFTQFHGREALAHSDMAMYESKSLGNYKLSIHLEEGGGLL